MSAIALVCALSFSGPQAGAGKVMPPAKTDVVIIGAGLSGLATAYQLKKAGIPFHILEITPRVGGRVRTAHYYVPGKPVLEADSGMEEYWESNPAVNYLRALGLKLRSDAAGSSLVLQGKVYTMRDNESTRAFVKRLLSPADFDAWQAYNRKVWALAARLKRDEPIPADLKPLVDLPFSKWTQSQLSPRASEWVRISVECEIGTSWERISALDGIDEYRIFASHDGDGDANLRVVGGNQKFVEALARAVGPSHVSVNERVYRIVSQDGKVKVYYQDTATYDEHEIEAHDVVSTIPLYRLFEVQFEPALSAKKRQAIATQTWGAYFKAHVFVPAKVVKKYFGTGDDSTLPLLSDSEIGVVYDGNPNQDTATKIVSLLVTGDYAEGFNMMPLDQVRTGIKAAFDRFWPGFSNDIQNVEFYRFHPRAIAAWPVGRSRFDELSQEVRKPENGVYLSGDFTESSHSSGAFESAERVARDLIARHKSEIGKR